MVRLSYVHEMRSALTYPLAAALAEGSFTGVVAAKYFKASPVLIAVITAAPMFGNIMALVWAELAKTRRKVPFVNLLQLGVITTIAAVVLTRPMPRPVGAWVFAGLIILARLLAAGIVTLRSAIWRFNYPRHLRGQIIGRITVVATAVLAATTFFGAKWLDHDPGAFVWLYPGAAVLGLVGIWQFSHIRIRNEGKMLRRERIQQVYTLRPESMAQTDEANVLNYQPSPRKRGLRGFFAESLAVMREDKTFRSYQRWQFLSGAGFMMLNPPLLLMVSQRMTNPDTQYTLATVVLQIVPMMASILFTQIWAPIFDRMHITGFRVVQGTISLMAQITLLVGALTNRLWLVAVAQMLVGISTAGGNLAWNLGHNDFAPADRAATYMAVHVMLTGLRGCIAPFVGVWLYQSQWIGRGVFGISVAMGLTSLVGFMSMARHAPVKVRARQEATSGTVAVEA